MAEGVVCIDNAPDTLSMAMSRTFRCSHREKGLQEVCIVTTLGPTT
jgi:hypothetical protein